MPQLGGNIHTSYYLIIIIDVLTFEQIFNVDWSSF